MSAITSFEIRLDRINKIYQEDDTITGNIFFDCKHEIRHEGLNLWLEGSVSLQTTSKNVGLLDTFSNSVRPISIIHHVIELPKINKITVGQSSIPFSISLKPNKNKALVETYHGVFIMIQYLIKCEIKRSILNKDLQRSVEIIVENKVDNITRFPTKENKTIMFTITPDSYEVDINKFPSFKIMGQWNSTVCRLYEPFTGKLLVANSNTPIRSIELQLNRIETCGNDDQMTLDATEVQRLQIADGDVMKNVFIPVYMLFPRLFTCATIKNENFKIEFELILITIFDGNFVVKEKFPIELVRY